MNTKLLKQKILDLAIHGKLVPQNPEDEPASVLLEKIRAEKEEKIRKGEIKRDKKDSHIIVYNGKYCEKFADGSIVDIDKEIPFVLPKSWCWCKLKSFFSTISTKKYQILEKEIVKEGKFPVISQSDNFIEGYSNNDDKLLSINGDSVIIFGDHTRNVKYVDFDFIVGADGVKVLKPISQFYAKFVYYLILIGAETIENRGYGRHFQFLQNCYMPLPPLAEQKRIVEQIEKIFAQIDYIEQNQTDLSILVKQAKSKILDLAIHGKLVEQPPQEESATVLLEKIRAEKEAKIKSGEIKRDKKDSHIIMYNGKHWEKFADGSIVEIEKEIPFELPEGWCWCRLRNIGQYKKGPFGSSLTKSMFIPKSENTIKVYEQKNAINKNHELGTYYISKDYFEEKMKSFEVFPGDIIVSCAGTIGETYIMPDGIEQGIINQALMKMNISDSINITYFLYFFDSILKAEANANGKGTAIKNIPPFDIFKQFLFPLPPKEEQERIINKIENLFSILDTIDNQLT